MNAPNRCSIRVCMCLWMSKSFWWAGWHPACQPPGTSAWGEARGQKTRKAVRKRGPLVICNLSCLLSSAAMLTSFFSCLMLITVLSKASHGLPPPHVAMVLDCQLPPESHWCGTLDRTAAAGHLVVLLLGSSREVLGEKKTKKMRRQLTHRASSHEQACSRWHRCWQARFWMYFHFFFRVLLSAF